VRAVADGTRRNRGLQDLCRSIVEMQARAIARWSSDGGELRRRAVVTVSGEETEEEEKTKTTAMIIYIRATVDARVTRGSDQPRRNGRWRSCARLEAVRSSPASGRRCRPAVGDDFEIFIEMPLVNFYKLLSNFL
jgi:hypothetical protein